MAKDRTIYLCIKGEKQVNLELAGMSEFLLTKMVYKSFAALLYVSSARNLAKLCSTIGLG